MELSWYNMDIGDIKEVYGVMGPHCPPRLWGHSYYISVSLISDTIVPFTLTRVHTLSYLGSKSPVSSDLGSKGQCPFSCPQPMPPPPERGLKHRYTIVDHWQSTVRGSSYNLYKHLKGLWNSNSHILFFLFLIYNHVYINMFSPLYI